MKEDFDSHEGRDQEQECGGAWSQMKHDLIKKIEDLDKEFEVNFNRYVSDTESKADNTRSS